MPSRREALVNNEYYHILNRGISEQNIFKYDHDYVRFSDCLKEFNTTEPTTIQLAKLRSRTPKLKQPPPKLVEILCYCLLPNHFHLVLKQLRENGITEFMRKIGSGYTNFFNLNYGRQGHLFQGKFKSVHIKSESQLLHISRYIHLNTLDLCDQNWREGKLADWKKCQLFLENYPWSSYPFFIEKTKSDFCNPEIFKDIFKTSNEYTNFLEDWSKRNLFEIENLTLE